MLDEDGPPVVWVRVLCEVFHTGCVSLSSKLSVLHSHVFRVSFTLPMTLPAVLRNPACRCMRVSESFPRCSPARHQPGVTRVAAPDEDVARKKFQSVSERASVRDQARAVSAPFSREGRSSCVLKAIEAIEAIEATRLPAMKPHGLTV